MEENKNTGLEQQQENIPEVEHGEIPPSSGEIISPEKTAMPETEEQAPNLKVFNDLNNDMETHANHLHKAPGHGWKHYVFEFLMLFLAVFCGFLAENFREEMVEHQREKEYIKSFAEDLKQDYTQLEELISIVNIKLMYRDSLLRELANPDIFKNSSRANYFTGLSYHFPDFIYNDRTMQQLKNNGGMRLIRNKAVSNSMMDYDSKVHTLFIHQDMMNAISLNFAQLNNRLFQKRLLETTNQGFQNPPVPLLTNNKADLEEFYNNMDDQRKGFIRLKDLDSDLLGRAARLIDFINKEYHLQ